MLRPDLDTYNLWQYSGNTWRRIAPTGPGHLQLVAIQRKHLEKDCSDRTWTPTTCGNTAETLGEGLLRPDLDTYNLWQYSGNTWRRIAPTGPGHLQLVAIQRKHLEKDCSDRTWTPTTCGNRILTAILIETELLHNPLSNNAMYCLSVSNATRTRRCNDGCHY